MIRDLAERNRSYRGYDHSRKISRDELLEFVDLTRFVASSLNHQVLKYGIVCNEENVVKIQECTGWAKALKDVKLPFSGKEPVAFIVICIDKSIALSNVVYLRDVGAVAQTILLAAVEKGLGGCMIGSINKEKISSILNLPDFIEPNLVVALGKPDENVVLTESKDGNTSYYRSKDLKTHFVPKRSLKEIVISDS